jgi:hypothetical protein
MRVWVFTKKFITVSLSLDVRRHVRENLRGRLIQLTCLAANVNLVAIERARNPEKVNPERVRNQKKSPENLIIVN